MALAELIVSGGALYAGYESYRRRRKRKKLAQFLLDDPHRIKNGNLRLLPDVKTALQRFGRDLIPPALQIAPKGGELSRIDDPGQLNEAVREINHYFVVSTATLATAVAGLIFYPPLLTLSVIGVIYGSIPYYIDSYYSLVKDRHVRSSVIDMILITGIVVTGHFFLAAIADWLIYLSEKLMIETEDHTLKSLVNVFGEQPQHVWVKQDGMEIEIPFESLQMGDIVVVNTGEMMPIDGSVAEGAASIDQHVLTGESQPVEKTVGDPVFASTVVLSGKVAIKVEKTGTETVAAQIGEILNRTADFRESVQLRGRELADKGSLPALALGAITLPIFGSSGALAVLISSFGYNMRLIGPISVLNYLKITSQQGILIKDGRSLEQIGQVDTVVFDKTGTLTLDQPHVGNVYPANGLSEDDLLTYAAAAEYRQTHPIARAIIQEADERQLDLPEIDTAAYKVGYGIKVTMNGKLVRVGSARFMEAEEVDIPDDLQARQNEGQAQGYSFVYVALDDELGGAIELHATVRPEAQYIIQQLRERNLSMYIISGDHEEPTRKLAQELGIDHYFAETLPENKATLIQQLQNEGKFVCFVGDGINDSIALKQANVSISLRGASTAATDTAQIILMDESLKQLASLFEIAGEFESNMKINLVTTTLPGAICIGGVFLWHFGIVTGLIMYNVGLASGITNAMLPQWRPKSRNRWLSAAASSPSHT